MNAAVAVSVITEVLAALPTVITTGQQVVKLVSQAVNTFDDAFGDKVPTPDEISAKVRQIVANTAIIDAL